MFRKSDRQPLFGGTRYDYYKDDRKLGSLVLQKKLNRDLYIWDVEIDKPYRNHGYGTAMINETYSFARELYPDLRKYTLRVQTDNETAYRLYRRCRYHITGRGRDLVRMEAAA